MKGLLIAVGFFFLRSDVFAQSDCGPDTKVIYCARQYYPNVNPPPDPVTDGAYLQRLMLLAESARKAEDDLIEVLRDARKKHAGSGKDQELVAVIRLQREAAAMRARSYAAHNWVITETVRIYGIEPSKTSFGPEDGQPVRMPHWNPSFSDVETFDPEIGSARRKKLNEREMEVARERERLSGTNLEPGLTIAEFDPGEKWIRIYSGSFERNADKQFDPIDLASTIAHETVHWLDSMRRRGAMPSDAQFLQSERDAHSFQAEILKKLGGSAGKIGRVQGRADWYTNLLKGCLENGECPKARQYIPEWRRGRQELLDAVDIPRNSTERFKIEGEKRFYEDIESLGPTARAVREAAQKRFDAEEARAKENAQNAAWKYLKTVSGWVCSSPEDFKEQVLAKKVEGASLEPEDMRARIRREADALNECQQFVLSRLAERENGQLSGVVYWWAKEYKRDHPSFLSRVITGIGDFFSALSDLRSSGGGSSGGRGGGSGGSGRGPNNVEIPTNPNWDGLKRP